MTTTATATISPDPAALLTPPPATIGRFTVVGEIGRGANGVVFAARDPVLGRDVAIKAIPLTVDDRVRQKAEANFIKEARTAAGLNHPHIVTIFDAGKTDTLAYIAMERLHGRDLHEYLYVGARLGVRQAAALMARIADAVHYAHKRGLVHRDIKPSNIFLSRDMKPKVLDFGVALPRSERGPTQQTKLIGTPNYMSPEQARGAAIDARSDVFSLGAILYEMVTGKRAFDAPDIDALLAKLVDDAPEPVAELRPDAPPELVRIIDKAMSKDVESRYQTAGDFRNDLAAFAGHREMDAQDLRVPRSVDTATRAARRRWPLRIAVACGVLAAIAAGIWLTQQPQQQPATASTPVPEAPAKAPESGTTAPTEAPAEPAPVAAPLAVPALTAPARPERDKATPVERRPAAPPPADGTITLAIAPWGEVLVDGVSRGVSPPLTRMTLPPGSYSIEVRNGDAPPLKTSIEVRPGQTHAVRYRF